MQHGIDWRIGAAAAAIGVALAACGEVAPADHDGGADDAGPPGADAAGPDAAGPECGGPADCESGLCDDGVCATTRLEACRDVAPANASSTIVAVTTTFTPGVGWSEPAECAWTCDPDYCESASSCVYAYSEQGFETEAFGSQWFGGDDGPNGPRQVGAGQRIRTTSAIAMSQFGFRLTGGFAHGDGTPEEVSVRLELRNSAGTTLAIATEVVPVSFDGGWLWWDLDYSLAAATDYHFTAWVVDAYAEGAHTGIAANTQNAYPDGYRVSALDLDDDLSSWQLWSGSPNDTWDYAYRIRSAPACQQ